MALSTRIVHLDVTPRPNVAGQESDLMSYVLPARRLGSNLKALRIRAWGRFMPTDNGKAARLRFGDTVVAQIGTSYAGMDVWDLEATIIRTDATAQASQGRSLMYEGVPSTSRVLTWITPCAENTGARIVIKATGYCDVAGSVIQDGMIVEALN